ncbi:MAG: UDP-N-acetylmuramate:L-alanyl-gamma-D-glutamyl-meso-diaminopimelate ligase [Gammaproteobacteria bacterium]
MRIHILGIGGTFMGGLALLAKELGFEVSGSDSQVYPPMSDQLRGNNITLVEGYDPSALSPPPDLVLIGNALSRGNPCVEHVLDSDLPYMSGPQWLAHYVLPRRWVLAVSGTHGKTTTASLLAFILDRAGLTPGFLIGGVAENLGVSARLGTGRLFVVEADEYDSAFFDKRSKFVHYRPRSLIINNIEFDHADIFSDLKAMQTQFHHLVRTVPSSGLIIYPADDDTVCETLAMGCWSTRESFGDGEEALWGLSHLAGDHRHFQIMLQGVPAGEVRWEVLGRFNALNALAAVSAARHAGVEPAMACEILCDFQSVKRRLQFLETVEGISVYDDFAHHPTAIALTIAALRSHVGDARIVAVFEPRSNTMKIGVHRDTLAQAFAAADKTILYQAAELSWDLHQATAALGESREVFNTIDAMVDRLSGMARAGDHILIMSNASFGGIHQKLIARLKGRA